MSETDKELFEEAFSCHMSSQIGTCDCGRVFWDGHNTGYDWHKGQQDELIADQNATRVDWGVEYVEIFGAMYCQDCSCWQDKAQRIIDWLRDNQEQVGRFFQLEKKRLLNAAGRVPEVSQ